MSDSTVPAGQDADPLADAPTQPPVSPSQDADPATPVARAEPDKAPQEAAPSVEPAPPPLPELKEGDNMRHPCNCGGALCAPGEVAPNFAGSVIIIRHGLMQQIGQFRHDLPRIPPPMTKVVIRTDRGVEMGEVVSGISKDPCQRCITNKVLADFIANNGPEYPFRRDGVVLRVANPQDIIDHRHLETSSREEATYCRQQLAELNLAMRLVTVEHMLGGERIVFYFTAETRVDFRELVRRLAAQFRTRIEMRQVGARDEARVIADYER